MKKQKRYTEGQPHDFAQLREIVFALREEGGCAWDRAQTLDSLSPYLLSEAQEACDAIQNKDMENLCEELGDVLFEVLLFSKVAEQEGFFTLDDVIQGAADKMIRRHPHVFGEVEVCSAEEGRALWQRIKAAEKAAKEAKRAARERQG